MAGEMRNLGNAVGEVLRSSGKLKPVKKKGVIQQQKVEGFDGGIPLVTSNRRRARNVAIGAVLLGTVVGQTTDTFVEDILTAGARGVVAVGSVGLDVTTGVVRGTGNAIDNSDSDIDFQSPVIIGESNQGSQGGGGITINPSPDTTAPSTTTPETTAPTPEIVDGQLTIGPFVCEGVTFVAYLPENYPGTAFGFGVLDVNPEIVDDTRRGEVINYAVDLNTERVPGFDPNAMNRGDEFFTPVNCRTAN